MKRVSHCGDIGCFRNANFWNYSNSSIVPSGLQSQLVCVPGLGMWIGLEVRGGLGASAGAGSGERKGPKWTLNWGSSNLATNSMRAASSRQRWSFQEADRLESRLVEVLAPEAEIFRPASGGVYGQYFSKGSAVDGGLRFASEEQGFGVDV